MAADQSAEFGRWTAASNVDGLLLDQIQADIADLAVRYLAAPPARLFAELVRGRNTLFDMITNGRQAPRLTMRLYQAAAQVCAMLAHASADLGVGQAAMTQCRVALRCAEYAEHAALTGYIAWVQSNVLYWEGKHDAAAQLVSTALGSTSALGTARLRLASQLARIGAARGNHGQVREALGIAERASTVGTIDEPGVMDFSRGKAAYYASEACRELGGPADLAAAIRWAELAVDEYSTTGTSLAASAYFDLARAHIATGDLDVAGHQVVRAVTTAEQYRTVPVIGRARQLRDLLSGPGVIPDQLEAFCLAPAPTPRELPSSESPI